MPSSPRHPDQHHRLQPEVSLQCLHEILPTEQPGPYHPRDSQQKQRLSLHNSIPRNAAGLRKQRLQGAQSNHARDPDSRCSCAAPRLADTGTYLIQLCMLYDPSPDTIQVILTRAGCVSCRAYDICCKPSPDSHCSDTLLQLSTPRYSDTPLHSDTTWKSCPSHMESIPTITLIHLNPSHPPNHRPTQRPSCGLSAPLERPLKVHLTSSGDAVAATCLIKTSCATAHSTACTNGSIVFIVIYIFTSHAPLTSSEVTRHKQRCPRPHAPAAMRCTRSPCQGLPLPRTFEAAPDGGTRLGWFYL